MLLHVAARHATPNISVQQQPIFSYYFQSRVEKIKLHNSLLIHPPFLFRPWYAVSGVTILQFALYLYITQSYHHGECSISLALSFALQLETTVSYPPFLLLLASTTTLHVHVESWRNACVVAACCSVSVPADISCLVLLQRCSW